MINQVKKSLTLDIANKNYIESMLSKSVSNTINSLVSKFKEQKLEINFIKSFGAAPTTTIGLSPENFEFLESVKNSSFAFTLNCLIATAKDLGMTI